MILLNSPINTGDLDSNGPYTHVKICKFEIDLVSNNIIFFSNVGYLTSGSFIKGNLIRETMFSAVASDYISMISKLPLSGETIYDAAARELYSWLLSKGHYSGTYVE